MSDRNPRDNAQRSMMSQHYQATITCELAFEAAHFLPHVAETHKCRRMHGHSYRVELTLGGPIDAQMGWVMDFDEVHAVARPLIASLDHRVLNEITGLSNPTSENLGLYLFKQLEKRLPLLTAVTVHETRDARCTIQRTA